MTTGARFAQTIQKRCTTFLRVAPIPQAYGRPLQLGHNTIVYRRRNGILVRRSWTGGWLCHFGKGPRVGRVKTLQLSLLYGKSGNREIKGFFSTSETMSSELLRPSRKRQGHGSLVGQIIWRPTYQRELFSARSVFRVFLNPFCFGRFLGLPLLRSSPPLLLSFLLCLDCVPFFLLLFNA